jgi:hypothetical protein
MYHAVIQFTLSGAIIFIGILTLLKVSEPREVPLALLPLFFGLHEFTQGFVYLGMERLITPRALEMAETFYVFYAKGLLQFWVPLAVWLLEPVRWRKNLLGILTLFGGTMTLYALWVLASAPADVYLQNNALVYRTPQLEYLWLALGYIFTTCGALMLSSSIAIQLYGLLNLIGLSLVYGFKPYAFTSLWCLYAAILSGVLYFYFTERRITFLRRLKAEEFALTQKLTRELIRLQNHYPTWRERWQTHQSAHSAQKNKPIHTGEKT